MAETGKQEKLRRAFLNGTLKVRSVSPGGEVVWKRVLQVFRHEVPSEPVYALDTPQSSITLTGSHRVYVTPEERVPCEELSRGDFVVHVVGGHLVYVPVTGLRPLPPRQYMYDLTAQDHHNFVSGGNYLISNSPDRNYHFRPPESEGNIGAYNQVFGYIWEDAELLEYLLRALDWFNMFPPATYGLDTLDKLVQERPAWRSAILWDAVTRACFALASNWVSEEFSYSIGGVSLDIEKSSKYESLKQNAEGQFDKATEAKARTVKFMRGLSQPKYGVGVRSAFGPNLGRGILSPRNFL